MTFWWILGGVGAFIAAVGLFVGGMAVGVMAFLNSIFDYARETKDGKKR